MSCLVLTDRVHICVRKSPPPSLIYASIPMMVEATGGQLHCPTNAPADDSLTSSQRKRLCPKDIFRGGGGAAGNIELQSFVGLLSEEHWKAYYTKSQMLASTSFTTTDFMVRYVQTRAKNNVMYRWQAEKCAVFGRCTPCNGL